MTCLLALLAGGTTLGCSQDDDSSSSAPSPTTAAVCTSVDALQESVADLEDVRVREDGVAALQGAFSSVRSDVEQVVEDAQSEFSAQTDGLTADVSEIQTAIDQARAGPTDATLSAVVGSIESLVDDVAALADDVSSTC
jgi:hypothetical protein